MRFRVRPKSRLLFSCLLLVAFAERDDSAPVFAASSEEASPISTSCFGVRRECSHAAGGGARLPCGSWGNCKSQSDVFHSVNKRSWRICLAVRRDTAVGRGSFRVDVGPIH